MSHNQSFSSKRRSGAPRASQPGTQNRLKSERVQLELEANPTGGRVRKIAQRGTGGRSVQPLVLPAELPLVQVVLVFGADTPGVREVVVNVPPGSGVAVKEVARAAA